MKQDEKDKEETQTKKAEEELSSHPLFVAVSLFKRKEER